MTQDQQLKISSKALLEIKELTAAFFKNPPKEEDAKDLLKAVGRHILEIEMKATQALIKLGD